MSPGVTDGYAHRISASALKSRGLVRIFGTGKTWRAELTDRGREQFDHLRQEASSGPTNRDPIAAAPEGSSARKRENQAESAVPELLKTERLVAEVIAAGGRLILPDETMRGGVNWRQRAYAAQRHGKVPAGKHLSVSCTKDAFEIALLDGDTGNELGADAVRVPAHLSKYHRVAREFRDRTTVSAKFTVLAKDPLRTRSCVQCGAAVATSSNARTSPTLGGIRRGHRSTIE